MKFPKFILVIFISSCYFPIFSGQNTTIGEDFHDSFNDFATTVNSLIDCGKMLVVVVRTCVSNRFSDRTGVLCLPDREMCRLVTLLPQARSIWQIKGR